MYIEAPRPWCLQPGVMTPTDGDWTRSVEVCYNAGLDNAGCATRIRRQAKEEEQVEGGGPIRDGPGLRFGFIENGTFL
jgi:hypothetical protein